MKISNFNLKLHNYISDMKVLVIDNHDSFTYNLVQMLKECGAECVIRFFDRMNPEETLRFGKIVISPGPGIPSEKLKEIIRRVSKTASVLGICLGLQAITEVFGGKLKPSARIYHGEAVKIRIIHKRYYLFEGISDDFSAGRYHSWIADKKTLPESLEITAEDASGEIMGIRHKTLNIHAVQFHPESILTPEGQKIIENWLKN